MIELTLPGFGTVEDPRCIGFSYSHDYDAALARMPCELIARLARRLAMGSSSTTQLTKLSHADFHGTNSFDKTISLASIAVPEI